MSAKEKLVPLPKAAALFPSRPTAATLYRWASVGVAGKKLETTRCGGKRFISPEQARRFLTVEGAEDGDAS